MALATARADNVIGGGDWTEDRLIPDLVRGFLSWQPVLIRRLNAIRPWQHVLESLHGYLMLAGELLAQDAKFASAYNFGPSDEDTWPVERIATKLVDMWGNGASSIRDIVPGVHENHVLRLDASKARAEVGWNQSSESKRRWSGRWPGIALGIKGRTWRSSPSIRSWSMRGYEFAAGAIAQCKYPT